MAEEVRSDEVARAIPAHDHGDDGALEKKEKGIKFKYRTDTGLQRKDFLYEEKVRPPKPRAEGDHPDGEA